MLTLDLPGTLSVHLFQGYDSACMAIYLAAGHDATATMPVFAKWAACTGVFMFHIAEGEHQTACDKVSGSRGR